MSRNAMDRKSLAIEGKLKGESKERAEGVQYS